MKRTSTRCHVSGYLIATTRLALNQKPSCLANEADQRALSPNVPCYNIETSWGISSTRRTGTRLSHYEDSGQRGQGVSSTRRTSTSCHGDESRVSSAKRTGMHLRNHPNGASRSEAATDEVVDPLADEADEHALSLEFARIYPFSPTKRTSTRCHTNRAGASGTEPSCLVNEAGEHALLRHRPGSPSARPISSRRRSGRARGISVSSTTRTSTRCHRRYNVQRHASHRRSRRRSGRARVVAEPRTTNPPTYSRLVDEADEHALSHVKYTK